MIRFLLGIYIGIIIIDVILSYVPQYRNNEFAKMIRKLSEYSLGPVRRVLPNDLPFDISPLIVIILIRVFIAIF